MRRSRTDTLRDSGSSTLKAASLSDTAPISDEEDLDNDDLWEDEGHEGQLWQIEKEHRMRENFRNEGVFKGELFTTLFYQLPVGNHVDYNLYEPLDPELVSQMRPEMFKNHLNIAPNWSLHYWRGDINVSQKWCLLEPGEYSVAEFQRVETYHPTIENTLMYFPGGLYYSRLKGQRPEFFLAEGYIKAFTEKPTQQIVSVLREVVMKDIKSAFDRMWPCRFENFETDMSGRTMSAPSPSHRPEALQNPYQAGQAASPIGAGLFASVKALPEDEHYKAFFWYPVAEGLWLATKDEVMYQRFIPVATQDMGQEQKGVFFPGGWFSPNGAQPDQWFYMPPGYICPFEIKHDEEPQNRLSSPTKKPSISSRRQGDAPAPQQMKRRAPPALKL